MIRTLSLLLVAGTLFAQPVRFPGTIRATAGSQGQILYGASDSGIFKSTDAGVTWTSLYLAPMGQPQPAFARIAVDPNAQSDVYIVAGNRLWKTSDAGSTWALITGFPPEVSDPVLDVHVATNRPGVVYARAGDAILRSPDRGETWEIFGKLPFATGGHWTVNGGNSSIQYFAIRSGLYASANEGATWTATATLRTFQSTSSGASDVVSDPQNPNRVFVSVSGGGLSSGGFINGIHYSLDGGVNVTPPNSGTQPIRIFLDASGSRLYAAQSSGGFCRTDLLSYLTTCMTGPENAALGATPTSFATTAADRRVAGVVYARATRLSNSQGMILRSRDYGSTWTEVVGTVRPTLGRPAEPFSLTLAPESKSNLALRVASADVPAAVFDFTISINEDAPWLTASATEGSAPATVQLQVDTAGLEPGVYETVVRVTSAATINESVEIPVRLTVPAPVATPAPVYTLTPFAGTDSTTASGDGGQAAQAGLGAVRYLAIDQAGNLYVYGTTTRRIRRIAPNGVIATVAGTGATGITGDGGQPTQAAIGDVSGLTAAPDGTLFLTSSGTVRQVSAGVIRNVDVGTATLPTNPLVDLENRLWYRDLSAVRRYTPPSGRVNVTLPSGSATGIADMKFDAAGNLYFGYSTSSVVWKMAPDGTGAIIAGNGTRADGAEGVPATATTLNGIGGIAMDAAGNLFIGETSGDYKIRMVTPAGIVYTVATGLSAAAFSIVASEDGSLYVGAGTRIYKLTPDPLPQPSISTGPRNPASGQDKVAPGSLFEIQGVGLALYEETAPASDWPETLGGAQVMIGDTPALLGFASPSKIVGVIPAHLEPGEVPLTLTSGTQSGDARTFTLHPAAPGILGTSLYDASGNAVTPLPGAEVSVLITGYGRNEFFTLRLGDRECETFSIEAVSSMPGVGRAMFRVPEDLEPGEYELTLRVEEEAANAITVTIAAPEAPVE